MSTAIKVLATIATWFIVANAACTVKSQRRAWHTFSDQEKQEYIEAELCLMQTPTKVGLPGCNTLFDELQANHQIQSAWTHGVGAFLPFHRYLMHAHEYFIKTECGYKGAQPYWEETLDAGNFSSSIIFDSVLGFGGNGRAGDGCITDGPFSNYTNSVGPGYELTNHCINRNVSDADSLSCSQKSVDYCNSLETYDKAWPCIEAEPHKGGHAGVGGEMLNPISSPGDPIFYLHHTWLDKVWWDWQARNLSTRLTDISGSNVQDPNVGFPEIPGNDTGSPLLGNGSFPGGTFGDPTIKPPATLDGDPGNITTLNHVLSTLELIPNVTIADVMDIGGGYLCYEYV